jgi:hypothetical protein
MTFALVVTYCLYAQGRPSADCQTLALANVRAASAKACQVHRNSTINSVISIGRSQGLGVTRYECVRV